MRVTNEPGEGGGTNPFADLFRLQTDFQARLADETLRYLRRLQGTLGPSSPGTVVQPGKTGTLSGEGRAGEIVPVGLEIENLQRVHCMVSPQLTPLVGTTGTTWFPATEPGGATRLVAPGQTARIELSVPLPAELPPDTYSGALLLQGFRHGAIPIAIRVIDPKRRETTTTKKRKSTRKTAKQTKKTSKKTAKKAAKKTTKKSATQKSGRATGRSTPRRGRTT